MQDTAHLSLAEHGAYTMLLDHYYGSEEPLPDNDVALYRICRAFTPEEQAAVMSVADRYFRVSDDGKRHNKRADKEVAKRKAISHKRSMAGAKGADSKWHDKQDGKQMANATTPTTTATTTPTPTRAAAAPAREDFPTADETWDLARYVEETRALLPNWASLPAVAITQAMQCQTDPKLRAKAWNDFACTAIGSMEPIKNPPKLLQGYVRNADRMRTGSAGKGVRTFSDILGDDKP